MQSEDLSEPLLSETDFDGLDEFFALFADPSDEAEAKIKELLAELPAEAAA